MTPRPQEMSHPPDLVEEAEFGVPLLEKEEEIMIQSPSVQEEAQCDLSERSLRNLVCFSSGLGCSFGFIVPLTIFGASALVSHLCSRFQVELDTKMSTSLLAVGWNIMVTLLVLSARYLYRGVLTSRLHAHEIPKDVMENIRFMLWRTFSTAILLGILLPEFLLVVSCLVYKSSWCRVTSPGLTVATVLFTLCAAHCLYSETQSPLPIKDVETKPAKYHGSIAVV